MATIKVTSVPGTGYFLDLYEGDESRLAGPFERDQIAGRLRDIGLKTHYIDELIEEAAESGTATAYNIEPAEAAQFPPAEP